MAIWSGFFNSSGGDRTYDASKFADYFSSFFGNGVLSSSDLQVEQQVSPNMTLKVAIGKAFIDGYIIVNDAEYTATITTADASHPRIDRIVAKYNSANREITLVVKKGTAAASPSAPTLQRDASAYELGIADILVGAGVTSITDSNITDLRADTTYCGMLDTFEAVEKATQDEAEAGTDNDSYMTSLRTKEAIASIQPVGSGSVTILTGINNTYTITHNLGRPAIVNYYGLDLGGGYFNNYLTESDNNSFKIKIIAASGSASGTLYYRYW